MPRTTRRHEPPPFSAFDFRSSAADKVVRDADEDVYVKRRRTKQEAELAERSFFNLSSSGEATDEKKLETNARAVIFELDALAVGLADEREACLMDSISEWVPLDASALIMASCRGYSDSSRIRFTLCEHAVPFKTEAIDEILGKADELLQERLHKVQRHPSLIPIIHGARKYGWRSGVVHKGSRQCAWAVLKKLGVDTEFKAVATSENFSDGASTPYASLYAEAVRRLTVTVEKGVAICCTALGVLGACEAGMTSILLGKNTGASDADLHLDDLGGFDMEAILRKPAKDPRCEGDEGKSVRLLSVGEECQAMYSVDQMWYKAKILSVADQTYNVIFTNFGNTEDVGMEGVRPLLI